MGWIPPPLLLALAVFLGLKRIEPRHMLALAALAGAFIFTRENFVGLGAWETMGGIGLFACIVLASFAALKRPYLAQGFADLACRLAVLVACMMCLGVWVILGFSASIPK